MRSVSSVSFTSLVTRKCVYDKDFENLQHHPATPSTPPRPPADARRRYNNFLNRPGMSGVSELTGAVQRLCTDLDDLDRLFDTVKAGKRV
jgi:hypothetical protein